VADRGHVAAAADGVLEENVTREAEFAVDDEGEMVRRMAGGRKRLDLQAADLEGARDDLDAELVLVLDVIGVGVSAASSSGCMGAPESTKTAVPPFSSATRYAFESQPGSMLRSTNTGG